MIMIRVIELSPIYDRELLTAKLQTLPSPSTSIVKSRKKSTTLPAQFGRVNRRISGVNRTEESSCRKRRGFGGKRGAKD
jgi:hypothetical protein